MKTSAIPAARALVHACKARGIQHIVISPGSRNAPLTLSFTADPFFNCYSMVDERSAAFFALGLAQQLRHGVAVVCTSGSALLNYAPAVAEAFYSELPLIVISADRPPYKIDIGDGQTIRQENAYSGHIGYSALLHQDVMHAREAMRVAGLELPNGQEDLEVRQSQITGHNLEEIYKALDCGLDQKTPVHINVPLEEPLYGLTDHREDEFPTSTPAWKTTEDLHISWEDYGQVWQQAPRKMVLIGSSFPDSIPAELASALASDPSVLVFTETTSNCHHPEFFPGIDNILAPLEYNEGNRPGYQDLHPDILLTMGGMVVSKKIKAFLRTFRPRHHWHVGRNRAYNTYFSLNRHFDVSPEAFYSGFKSFLTPGIAGYRARWEIVRDSYRLKRADYLRQIPFSDFYAFHQVFEAIPAGYNLQLANSSTVRYSQLFELPSSIGVFCNRGTSGIEGSTSTAVGASLGVAGPTLLVTGDLGFLYDANGLWNAYLRQDFRIIVMNNGGGGIFRILPGKEDNQTFETFFETVHQKDLRHLCQLQGLEYERAENADEVSACLGHFFSSSEKPRLLEIRTPRLENDKILRNYFEWLS